MLIRWCARLPSVSSIIKNYCMQLPVLMETGVFGVLLWFAFGRYGSVKFGGPDAGPEFRKLSWIGMLFCAGIGTSLLYRATIEWVYYYQAPPFGIEPESAEAAH